MDVSVGLPLVAKIKAYIEIDEHIYYRTSASV